MGARAEGRGDQREGGGAKQYMACNGKGQPCTGSWVWATRGKTAGLEVAPGWRGGGGRERVRACCCAQDPARCCPSYSPRSALFDEDLGDCERGTGMWRGQGWRQGPPPAHRARAPSCRHPPTRGLAVSGVGQPEGDVRRGGELHLEGAGCVARGGGWARRPSGLQLARRPPPPSLNQHSHEVGDTLVTPEREGVVGIIKGCVRGSSSSVAALSARTLALSEETTAHPARLPASSCSSQS